MATIGGSTSQNGYGFWIEVWETRDDNTYLSTNTTTVNARLWFKNGDIRTNSNGWTFSLTINGTPFTYGGQTLNSTVVDFRQSYVVLSTKSVNVSHNSDGSKSVSVSGYLSKSYYSSYDPGYCSASGTFTCQTIPRGSDLTPPSNITTGVAKNLSITRKANSFKDTIRTKYNNQVIETIITKGPSSGSDLTWTQSWTPSNSLYANLTSTNKISVILEHETYNGDTSISVKQQTIDITIGDNNTTKPTISSLTLQEGNTDITSIISGWGLGSNTFIQNLSKIKITISASAYGIATILDGNTSIDGQTVTGYNIQTTKTITGSAGSGKTLSTTVTDSRGYISAAKTTPTYTVIAYESPKITVFDIERCDSSGNQKDDGTYLGYLAAGTISAINNKNSKSWKIRYKTKASSSWTEVSIGTSYTLSKPAPSSGKFNVLSGVTFNATTEYDIQLVGVDSFYNKTESKTLGVGSDLINFGCDGKSIGLGQLSTVSSNNTTPKLEVAMVSYLGKDVYFKGALYVWNGSSYVKTLWYE